MTIIETIREKVRAHAYEFTIPHFFEEMANDDLIFADIEMVIACGRIRRRFTHATPVARAMKLSAQQRTDEKLRLSAGRKKPASSSSLQPTFLSDA